ncbi:MAG: metal-dependent transcriptional regulator [Candidatus Bathyarchaeota archaeon]|nr:metal-dependent transcriptional regulator [Candidatus Bathyarchaeota archaeon]
MNEKFSSRVEDYLRSIYDVTESKGYARIKDVSREMDLKPSTVVGMMGKLKQLGLVNYEKYGEIKLTSRGKQITAELKNRRETFEKFLEIILVPKKIAAKDAHILEHQLDSQTIQQFSRFVEFITQKKSDEHMRSVDNLMSEFRTYCGKS